MIRYKKGDRVKVKKYLDSNIHWIIDGICGERNREVLIAVVGLDSESYYDEVLLSEIIDISPRINIYDRMIIT